MQPDRRFPWDQSPSFGLPPPAYDLDRAVPLYHYRRTVRLRGALLCLITHRRTVTPEEVETVLQPFWRWLWAPRVVVLPTGANPPRSVRMGRLGIDAVLQRQEVSARALRRVLTEPGDFKSGVPDRLGLHGWHLDNEVRRCIETLMAVSSMTRTDRILQAASVSLRTASRHLSITGLPPPGAWKSFARGTRAVLALQRERAISVERAALDHGFADGAGLDHLCRRTFNLSATNARDELGWQSLLWCFLQRHSAVSSPLEW